VVVETSTIAYGRATRIRRNPQSTPRGRAVSPYRRRGGPRPRHRSGRLRPWPTRMGRTRTAPVRPRHGRAAPTHWSPLLGPVGRDRHL